MQISLTCDAKGILRVKVTVQRDVPTTLGRLAGISSIKATRQASAGAQCRREHERWGLPAHHL